MYVTGGRDHYAKKKRITLLEAIFFSLLQEDYGASKKYGILRVWSWSIHCDVLQW